MATVERPMGSLEAGGPREPPSGGRRPPAPLVALLAVAYILAAAWSLVTPPWQAPDEPYHFSYVQTVGELGRLPGGEGKEVSTALGASTDVTDFSHVLFDVKAHPDWTRVRADAFGRGESGLDPRDGGGPSPASTYPPLYYATEALPYLAAREAGIFTQLAVVRLTSALWILVTVTAAWLLAGELFDRRRLPQLMAAATVALWPLMTFVYGGVNPDALVVALWTLVLWLGTKVLRRGLTLRRSLALGALTGAALVAKISSFVLVPVIVGLLACAAWRARRGDLAPRRSVVAVGLAIVAMAVPLAAWSIGTAASGRAAYGQASAISENASTGFQVREFASYLWQFYLPPLGFMTPVDHQYPVISARPAINIWLGTGSAVFGWVNVWFPRWVYWAIGAAALGLVALFAAASARWWRAAGRGGRLRRLGPAALLAGTAVITLAALHYTDYTFYASQQGKFIQGRYLLPLAGVAAAIAGWALTAVPRRRQALVAGAWMGGLLALDIAALGLALGRWYA